MKCALVLAALPVLALAACNKPTTAVDSAAELAAIHAVEQAQMAAFNAHDLEGAVAGYAENAMFVGPGEEPARGIDAVRASAEALIKDPNMHLDISGEDGWVAASGDLAVTTARWKLAMTGADGMVANLSGINTSTWTKQADGGWKMILDFNQATPTAPELPE